MKEKIAICTPGFAPVPALKGGAVETLITYLIEENEKKNIFDIDVYTIYDDSIKDIKYKNTTLYKIHKNKMQSIIARIVGGISNRLHVNVCYLDFADNYLKEINKHKYDKIIIENNMLLYKKIYKNYKYKTKFYYHQHNNMNEPGKTKYYAKIIANSAEEIMFVSKNVKEAFNKETKTNVGQVYYNCIDFDKFNYKLNEHREDFIKEIGLNKDNYNFMFSGRMCSDKGVVELIEAFKKINEKYSNTHLTIIGIKPQDTRNKYQNKIIKLCQDENIDALNFMNTEELIKHIVSNDCVVIPSMYNEAFGVVSLESMAMKKTIIATKAGGLVEPLSDNSAIIVDRENIIENLYDAMERVIVDRDYANKLAENAYNRVHSMKEFDRKNYFDYFVDYIKEREN